MSFNQNTSLTPLERFWRLLKPDYKDIRNIYFYAIFAGLISLSLPLGIQAIVNLIQGGEINMAWVILVSLVVAGVVVAGLLQIFQLRITENLQQKIFARAAFEFGYRIPRIRMEAMYSHYGPELVNRFFDTITVQKGLPKILIDFSGAALYIFFGLILLSVYHPFFLVFSIFLVLLVLLIFRITLNPGLKTSLRESKYKYKVAHWLEELARASATFRLTGNSRLPLDKTDDYVGEYLDSRERHFSILIRQYGLLVTFKAVVATGLLAIGGILVMEQQMNIGQFVAAEIIILSVMTSVEKLIFSFETIYDMLTALEKIAQVTDMELEQTDGLDITEHCDEKGLSLDISDMSFRYPGTNRNIIEGLNLNAESGERVLITGPNGSGKSTLLHLIAGLYKVQSGTIAFNGLPLGNLSIKELRSVIGTSFSEDQLFEGTVLDNISMRRDDISMQDVRAAVDKLGLSEFIENMPMGYNSSIDPQGSKLPKSVVQKFILARAIVGRPRLLLLEDAFTEIEEKDRKVILNYLMDKSHSWTIVATSADRNLRKYFDRTFELNLISNQ